jgi:hypothetical protein
VALALCTSLPAALIPLGLGELIGRSKLVVTGEVVAVRSYRGAFLDLGEVIFTDVTVRIESALKGTMPETREVTIQVLGGKIGTRFQRCPESATYATGEKVLVFLRDYNQALWNTGWMQGKYTLRAGGTAVAGEAGKPIATDLTLDQVKAEIARVAASAPPLPRKTAGGEGK